MNRYLAGARCACLLLLGLATPVMALEPLTLPQAIAAALEHNADLDAFTFQQKAQAARAQQAALRPAPTLSFELENFAGSGDMRGLSRAEGTLALSQVVELGGKRSARVTTAEAEQGVLNTDQQILVLDVLAETTRRFISVAERQQLASLAHTAVLLAEKTAAATEKRVNAAKSPHVEYDRARIALTRTRLDERHASHQLDAARIQLAAMWGASRPVIDGKDFEQVSADLFKVPAVGEFSALSQALERNPDFLKFASTSRLRDAEIRLAASQRQSDLGLSAGIRRFEDSGDAGFVAGISLPLFASSRAKALVSEAEVRRASVDAERSAAMIKARATLYALHQELRHTAAETDVLKQETLPQMEEALKETEYAYDRGRYSLLEWVDAQREYLNVQRALITAAAEAHTLQAEIERLTNAPLNTP